MNPKINIRKNNIECRCRNQGNCFEIVRWVENPYYGKLDDYLAEGATVKGGFVFSLHERIDRRMFDIPQSCYTVAFLDIRGNSDIYVDLRTVGGRVLDLSPSDLADFMEVYRESHCKIIEAIDG